MNITEKDNNIIIKQYDSFDIEHILECGQCFRFNKINQKKYLIVAHKRELIIEQCDEQIIFYSTSISDFYNIWQNYFDFNTDYSKIKKKLSEDKILKEAIDYAPGIRILNQDFFECLISFIISQNNRIPMIKQVIENLSNKYGETINTRNSFPSPESFNDATELEIKEQKTGFRAKYILDATNKITSDENYFNKISALTSDMQQKELMKIKGVGPKVSNCVMLFSLKQRDSFPVDVWIKRVMEHFYFDNKETDINTIYKLAKDKFGDLAGYAQQYLFYYARSNKVGVK